MSPEDTVSIYIDDKKFAIMSSDYTQTYASYDPTRKSILRLSNICCITLPYGTYVIRLERKGYKSSTEQITVKAPDGEYYLSGAPTK